MTPQAAAARLAPLFVAVASAALASTGRPAALATAPTAVVPYSAPLPATQLPATPALRRTQSAVEHVVVVIQENHAFDSYYGAYCTAPAGTEPPCTEGPACCEAAPLREPGPRHGTPESLTDGANGAHDPDHSQAGMLAEMHDGRMDRFVSGTASSSPRNFAVARGPEVQPYWDLARRFALADRYFHSIAGASSSNDMYFARAGYVFTDNSEFPDALGKTCARATGTTHHEATVADLVIDSGATFSFYAEGYAAMKDAVRRGACPTAHPDCPARTHGYPCTYDASDVPFAYYERLRDDPRWMRDLDQLDTDIAAGNLPDVVFVKALGFRTEHPGGGTKVSTGADFVRELTQRVLASPYGETTLVLATHDESGGYFDHVAPPPRSAVDGMPYGPRVPLLAMGRFARKNHVSHVTMEHSSIVKFIEWNWLGGATGQLGTRDTVVNNIGSLLDPAETGVVVPAH